MMDEDNKQMLEAGLRGEWGLYAELDGEMNGFPNRKLFDAGFVRDEYGAFADPLKLEALVSTSEFGGFCKIKIYCSFLTGSIKSYIHSRISVSFSSEFVFTAASLKGGLPHNSSYH